MTYNALPSSPSFLKEQGADGFARPGAVVGSLLSNPRRRLWVLLGLAYVVVGYLTIPSQFQRNYSDIPPFLKQERMKEIRRQCRHTPPGTRQTTDMPLAHLISSHHDESVIGAAVLIEEIFDVDDVYVIHVKKGAKIGVLESVQNVFKDCRNVVWVPDDQRVDSGYADFSIVAMELVMIKIALEVEMDWVYALLMDGSSWPVMPLEERRDWFRALPKDSSHTYIRNNDGTVQLTCDRGNWKCVRTPARCANAACDKYTLTPEGSPITMGWQWVRLSRELSYWLINDPIMEDWRDFFNGTEIPGKSARPDQRFPSAPFDPRPRPAQMSTSSARSTTLHPTGTSGHVSWPAISHLAHQTTPLTTPLFRHPPCTHLLWTAHVTHHSPSPPSAHDYMCKPLKTSAATIVPPSNPDADPPVPLPLPVRHRR